MAQGIIAFSHEKIKRGGVNLKDNMQEDVLEGLKSNDVFVNDWLLMVVNKNVFGRLHLIMDTFDFDLQMARKIDEKLIKDLGGL